MLTDLTATTVADYTIRKVSCNGSLVIAELDVNPARTS